MTIIGFVPDEVTAKMADTLRTALSAVTVAADVPNQILAVPAKNWNVSSLYSRWEDFKKATPSSGQSYGGHLLLTAQGLPLAETAPPAWNAGMMVRLRMGIPVTRATGQPTDFAAIAYPAACRRKLVETVTLNRRWGYNNVYASGLKNWAKVEDGDTGFITMDNTIQVQFTFIVTPVG